MSQGGPVDRKLTGGTLDRHPPVEVFRNLYSDRATAEVLFSSRSEERHFWLDRGQLVAAASNREAQQVGELLRTFGLADESVLFAAFERALAEPGRGLSKALAETGAVPRYVADACVRALAERILYSTFGWTSGSFTITPLEKLDDIPLHFDKSNASLLLEGLRRFAPGAPVPGVVIDTRSRPVPAADLLFRYQLLLVSKEEADLLSQADGTRTAAELSADTTVIARFIATGALQLAGLKKAEGDEATPGGSPLNIEISGAPPAPRAAEQVEAQTQLVWNTYRRIDWSTFYEVLGVAPDAPLADVHRAVHERARAFHPDNYFKAPLSDARTALEGLFTHVLRASRVFRTAQSREAYDRSLESKGQVVSVLESKPTPEVQKQIARANYLHARTLYEQEDYYPAYEMVKQSVEFDPKTSEYWILLSRVQRKNPKWVRQSAETMRRAVGQIPDSVELLHELAEACGAERNEPERVKALKEILKLDPANRRAQSALAEIASMKPGR